MVTLFEASLSLLMIEMFVNRGVNSGTKAAEDATGRVRMRHSNNRL